MSSQPERGGGGWPRDAFAWSEISSWLWAGGVVVLLALLLITLVFPLAQSARSRLARQVVIYTSQDQYFAEPVLAAFTRQTGIRVRAVYDSEAVKTVGLANRLLAEAGHPQCDVWWSNEALRTRQLLRRGVLETNSLREFGFRSRRLVINTNRLTAAAAPRSLLELTNAAWRGRVALAYPLFGTTSAEFAALRGHWGAAGWEAWCRALAANRPFVVDGNSVVVRLVGRGEAVVGLTDFDDIEAGRREGLPVAGLPRHAGSVLIPNSVAVVRGAPHPAEAARLIEYLAGESVRGRLTQAAALEGGTPPAGESLPVDWEQVADELEPAAAKLGEIFLR